MAATSGKRHVVLVGSMGVGKTTIAELLADRLDWPVEDDRIDRPVHLDTARGEDRHAHGEAPPQPHKDAEHLLGVLEHTIPTVVSAADGVVDSPRCRDALRDEYVVWLRARPATVAERLHTHGEELGPELEETLTALADRRVDHYRRVADLVVDTDNVGPAEVTDRVMAWLDRRHPLAGDEDRAPWRDEPEGTDTSAAEQPAGPDLPAPSPASSENQTNGS
jgi:shikimate kinase